ncbi:amidohydrolase family protein [Candidatus Poribacteria bacterium]|nr:amidohydrolase family protein [Candidatus Poribacteria bacterium]
MIIDSHTHAWEYWPYKPSVPDFESRGRVEQLLWEMDRNDVDKAVLVCARIDHNPENNHYISDCVEKYPQHLIQFADVDCSWTSTYHKAGASERLNQTAKKYNLKGYTHYLKDDYQWFESIEGLKFFEKTAELNLIASLALNPKWMPALRKLARKFQSVIFICHHMAGIKAGEKHPRPELQEVLKSSELPNIYIKLSGFSYVSRVSWDYPYSDTFWLVRKLYEYYGPERLCWGSDYPVVRFSMTYQQSLEAFRKHCAFIPDRDKELILGGNLQRLLEI